ncbi:MAG: TetR/AcrR family transcriptional regulator [Bacteroidetes bacterium]|nr:TetR/AcrR family transcriptional regulator [Bacteroidota bacterium]
MVNSQLGTEEKILEAAKKVFHRKGYEGARMQEIADEAGINKALLHYYFRSKEKLFEAVFEDALSGIMRLVSTIFFSDKPLKDKIQSFLCSYLNIITENSYIPWFIINGIYERPEQIKAIFDKQDINPLQLMKLLKSQVRKEYGVDINPFQIWLNVLSLSVFPVIAKPLVREIFRLSEETYNQLMEERKELVPELIINALKAYEKGEN